GVADRHPENAVGEVSHLDRRESLNVQIGVECAQTTQEFEVPLLLESWMQTANHVDLSDAQRKSFSDGSENFIDRVLKCMGVAFLCGERAKLAGEHANV